MGNITDIPLILKPLFYLHRYLSILEVLTHFSGAYPTAMRSPWASPCLPGTEQDRAPEEQLML